MPVKVQGARIRSTNASQFVCSHREAASSWPLRCPSRRQHAVSILHGPMALCPRAASWQLHSGQLHSRWEVKLKVTEAPTSITATEAVPAINDSRPFVWTKQWWPLIPLNYLDPNRPKAMTVMGVQLVVWRDGEGQWRCFKDACPHRLAPLSEGRVESDGTLLCAYHAWRFDSEGKCTTIPQSTSLEAEATAKASRRSCATSFPTQEKVGLLWVWPDDADSRWIDAAAAEPLVSRSLEERHRACPESLVWFMRDMPYGYETLLENLVDPAHFPVSHHKLTPQFVTRYKICGVDFYIDRNPDAASWASPPDESTASASGNFLFSKVVDMSHMANMVMRFNAPSFVVYGDVSGTFASNQMYGVPVAPGQSRALVADVLQPVPPPPPTNMKDWFKQTMIMRMLQSSNVPINRHRRMLKLFDGDSVFLNMQENILHREHNGDWRKAYFMPAPCDRGVVAALSWLDKVGRPFPNNKDNVRGPIDRRVLLDRHSQHTAHCPICQQEVKRLEALALGAKLLAAACFLVACAIVGSMGVAGLGQAAAPFVTKAGAAVGGLLAVAAWAATALMDKFEKAKQEFLFTDYVHADID